jgi:hypothetical protein
MNEYNSPKVLSLQVFLAIVWESLFSLLSFMLYIRSISQLLVWSPFIFQMSKMFQKRYVLNDSRNDRLNVVKCVFLREAVSCWFCVASVTLMNDYGALVE